MCFTKNADGGIYRYIGDGLRQNPGQLMKSPAESIRLVITGKYVMIDVEYFPLALKMANFMLNCNQMTGKWQILASSLADFFG